jgi:hypothetical protein
MLFLGEIRWCATIHVRCLYTARRPRGRAAGGQGKGGKGDGGDGGKGSKGGEGEICLDDVGAPGPNQEGSNIDPISV